jgi:hypothetical protein
MKKVRGKAGELNKMTTVLLGIATAASLLVTNSSLTFAQIPPCTLDSECPRVPAQRCWNVNKACVLETSRCEDAPAACASAGGFCVSGACEECKADTQEGCPDGFRCAGEGFCEQAQCTPDRPCPGSDRCEAGVCVSQRQTIGFNNAQSLLAAPPYRGRDPGVPLIEALSYREHGMVFTDGVSPADPENLPRVRECRAGTGGFVAYGHFHLEYEDPTIKLDFDSRGKQRPGRFRGGVFEPVNPENQPRMLGPMLPGAVIQMVYDPQNRNVPEPFNLISIDVRFRRDNMGKIVPNRLNVGTKSPTTGIRVYNNLTSGFTWSLISANNLMRATLEFPCEFAGEGFFLVDNIVFEPASSVTATALTPAETTVIGEARALKLEDVLPRGLTPSDNVRLHQDAPAFAPVDIGPAQVTVRGPGQDQFNIQGNIELGAESDGVSLLNEGVTVTFDGFSETILAGRFRCAKDDEGNEKCEFKDTSGGITEMAIAIREDQLEFQVQATGLDLSGIELATPVPVSVQIGDDLGVREIRFGPEIIINDFIAFKPVRSTFKTTSDATGCPSGFVGTFSFSAELTNVSDSVFSSLLFSSLVIHVASLTNGNLLQNADRGPGGVGARLTFPEADGFADGVLSPGESADVPVVICLREERPFTFFVNALGVSR